jgi:hypothetical protein
MEIRIKSGYHVPVMTWALFVWKFFMKELAGIFSVNMTLWDFTPNDVAHQVFAKKSYFSSDGVALLLNADSKHVGRYRLYAFAISGDTRIHEFVTYIYNGVDYKFAIEKYSKGWKVSVDNNNVLIETGSVPIFTYNELPKVNEDYMTDYTTIINFTQ